MPMILLALLLAAVSAAEPGQRVEYVGGTLPDLPGGVRGRLSALASEELVLSTRSFILRVPYDRINLLEYGQQTDRRYVLAILVSPLFLLSKARQHYLTLGFQDDEGRQHSIVLRVEKGDLRPALAALEARTGLRIRYLDDEARTVGRD